MAETVYAYACGKCGNSGVKLWRWYNTAMTGQDFFCAECALRDQGKEGPVDESGLRVDGYGDKTDQIGALVPAVPCDGGRTCWGYLAIPRAAYAQWRALPNKVGLREPIVWSEEEDPEKAVWRAERDQRIKRYYSETVFVVRADDFARHALWEKHSADGQRLSGRKPGEWVPDAVEWEQLSQGDCPQVGELGGRPVCLTVFWNRVDGQLVAFWNACSQVVDYEMIDEWLDKTFAHVPRWGGGRLPRENAMNFHACLAAVREHNEVGRMVRRVLSDKR